MDPGYRGAAMAPRVVLRLVALGLLCVAVLALGACGDDSDDSSSPSGPSSEPVSESGESKPPVAQFDGRPITRAEFDAWFAASIANSRSNPQKEMMIVPDPPPHKRCLEGYENIMTKRSRYLGSEQPKNECRAGWKNMMNSVMRDLITLRWLEAEARKQGIEVDDEEAKTAFARDLLGTEAAKQQWGEQSYEDLVENLGEEHVLLRARTFALQQKIAAEGKPPAPNSTKRYRALTSCARGFRTIMCSNGPKPPRAPVAPQPAPGAPGATP